jgi:hypothetical protein
MAAAEFPCALCKQFLQDYLDYSLRTCFRKREAAAKALHPIFLRDLLADMRELFTANELVSYRLSRCRAMERRKGATDAMQYLFAIDPRLRRTLDEWAILSVEAGLGKLELIETWVSHTIYEVFTIIEDYHKGHIPRQSSSPPSSPTEEVADDYGTLEILEDPPPFTL